ncbi:hypothetical protein SS05631_c39380 [Sinorhizobium sp. CCBAU 05631]|nr:hypothetical protein SS05631_c39380 [Sinorhizobium sp. CCBAU 05631]
MVVCISSQPRLRRCGVYKDRRFGLQGILRADQGQKQAASPRS